MTHSKKITRRAFVQVGSAAAITLGVKPMAGSLVNSFEGTGERPSPGARQVFDLCQLKWQLCGFTPYLWAVDKCTDICNAPDAEIGPIDAPVPGSVQKALLDAGIVPDWNFGLNSRALEWVENRDWIYQARIPDEWIREGSKLRLRCAGLDYAGSILINGSPVFEFMGSFTPYEVDLKPYLKPSGNLLQIWFQQSPRWLGQFGYTSQMKEWKPRFNYSWDWIIRLVQIGIWDSITLEAVSEGEISKIKCSSDAALGSQTGTLRLSTETTGGNSLHIALTDGDRIIREERVSVGDARSTISWDRLPVELWWPNGLGKQPLYDLDICLLDAQDRVIDMRTLRVGFRHIEWRHTYGASETAQPYLCVVNGKPLFLFGVNWTPIRPNFADLREDDYRKRIALYRDLGLNILRVWGGGFPEREWLFDLCDENGLLVWQEFPLSSSGLDNDPPRDERSISELARIAEYYVDRLQHHTSVLLWCGGNELAENRPGHSTPQPTFTIARHPMITRLQEVANQHDPARCFLPTTPFGPVGSFTRESCGKSQHWDVHGPWNFDGPVDGPWSELWRNDDAMFHSELGAPSASPAAMIRRFCGNLPATPGSQSNPLWNRQPWWIDWSKFAAENGREPATLEEFVTWSQKRQADALVLAVSTAQSRFPACGGVILWMGHDCFPCTSNTSIVDFDGNPKPAALALRKVIRTA